MSTMAPPTIEVGQEPRWDDPERCPFCGSLLADGGAGFIDHTDESPSCKAAFDRWREQVSGDVVGEWTG